MTRDSVCWISLSRARICRDEEPRFTVTTITWDEDRNKEGSDRFSRIKQIGAAKRFCLPLEGQGPWVRRQEMTWRRRRNRCRAGRNEGRLDGSFGRPASRPRQASWGANRWPGEDAEGQRPSGRGSDSARRRAERPPARKKKKTGAVRVPAT